MQEIEEGLKQCRPEMKWMEMNFTLSITETIVWEYEVSWRQAFGLVEASSMIMKTSRTFVCSSSCR